MLRKLAIATAFAALPAAAVAQAPAASPANSGDTAWILASSALVLLMTLPGLGLFYGGLVRAKNVLSVLLQIGAVAAVASVLWIAAGYTLAFGDVGSGWLGDSRAWMFNGLGEVREGLTIPENTFAMFQLTFAAITPALMVGAWVDRARFSWVVVFCAIWGLLVYAPVAHWIWGGGWLAERGTLDFAGGMVVHTTAGVSALVIALLLGKRQVVFRT
jgi:Amt family ammonium transporter